METRSNKLLVAFVVALVLAGIVAFSLWMTASQRTSGRPFDIVLTKSVAGLLVGSPVTFAGVPVGRVTSVDLDPVRPGAVRVRIDITNDDLPVQEGIVANLNGNLLFGTALISLERKGPPGPPLLARAGEEAPIIPLAEGGMGDVIADPTPMVESIASATDRLLAATTPEQQRLLAERFAATERATAEIANEASATLGSRIAPARQMLREGTASAVEAGRQARLMRENLQRRSRAASRDLRASMSAARESTAAFDERIQAIRPKVQEFSKSVAEPNPKIQQARETVAAITEQVQQVEKGGLGGMGGPPTPDYKPKKDR
ncbi:MlaD family protein [Allosphingosinicella sp.]|uniref:MlaD family protein n=1 Tax=Allosphingosinicella sp. TaxID=2823234 RepID=UPI002EF60230